MRDSFIFYRSFAEGLRKVDTETRDKLILAILDFALDDKPPKLEGFSEVMFDLIKPQLEANTKRYEHGLKGGAPKENQNAKKQLKQPETTTDCFKEQPNNNVNVNDNVNKNVNVKGDCKGKNLFSPHVRKQENADCLDNSNSETEFQDNTQKAKTKKAYGSENNVLLTDEQHAKLQSDYGSDLLEMVEYLSDYIAKKGGKIKKQDHNRVLRGWVKDAVREQKLKQQELKLREKELEARQKRFETGYSCKKSDTQAKPKLDTSTDINDWI